MGTTVLVGVEPAMQSEYADGDTADLDNEASGLGKVRASPGIPALLCLSRRHTAPQKIGPRISLRTSERNILQRKYIAEADIRKMKILYIQLIDF
jgi:hypothetical protein